MKFRVIPQEEQVKKIFFLSITISLATGGFVLLFWQNLPPQVPLFYSRPWGEEQLGQPHLLALPLLLGIVFLGLNSFLSYIVPENSFLKRVLILGGLMSCLLASIALIRIVLLVI